MANSERQDYEWTPAAPFAARVCSIALLACIALSGCSTLGGGEVKSTLIKRDGVSVVLDHSVGVGFVFKDNSSKERVCRTPGPDFASGTAGSLSLGLPKGSDVGIDSNYSALSMGGRAPGVLALRELMFRACELVLNTNATPEQALIIYKQFIKEGIRASQVLANSQGSTASSVSSGNSPLANTSQPSTGSDTTDATGSWDTSSSTPGAANSSANLSSGTTNLPSGAPVTGPLPAFNPNGPSGPSN